MVAQNRNYLFFLLVAFGTSFVSTAENAGSVVPAPSTLSNHIKKRTKAPGIQPLVANASDVLESWSIAPATSKLTSQPTPTPIHSSSQPTANVSFNKQIQTNLKPFFLYLSFPGSTNISSPDDINLEEFSNITNTYLNEYLVESINLSGNGTIFNNVVLSMDNKNTTVEANGTLYYGYENTTKLFSLFTFRPAFGGIAYFSTDNNETNATMPTYEMDLLTSLVSNAFKGDQTNAYDSALKSSLDSLISQMTLESFSYEQKNTTTTTTGNTSTTTGSSTNTDSPSASTSTSVGYIIGGLAISVFCGILNGSWNAAFNPKVALAVGSKSTVQTVGLGRQRTMVISLSKSIKKSFSRTISNLKAHREYDLDYHYAWMLFQLWAAVFNVVVCIFWAGGASNVKYVVTHVPVSTILLLVFFSALWGVGSILFGLSCKIAGVGLGTNLVFCVNLMLGTFLPLVIDKKIKTATGGVIMAGLAVVSAGLYFSADSLRIRDLDFAKTKRQQTESASVPLVSNVDDKRTNNDDESELQQSDAQENIDEDTKKIIDDELSQQSETQENSYENNNNNDHGVSEEPQQSEAVDNSNENSNMPKKSNSNISTDRSAQAEPEYSVFTKISVCLIAGIFCSMLQFDFIFGRDLIVVAEQDGATPSGGSAAIIWLFAITVGAIPSIIYGFVSSPKEIPLKTIWMCPWWRHLLLICSTSLPWIAQIHLYGLAANVFLPKDFAASIAWPTVMTTTVAQGMALSICLGEWKGACAEALSKLRIGLSLTLTGVVVFMLSVLVKK